MWCLFRLHLVWKHPYSPKQCSPLQNLSIVGWAKNLTPNPCSCWKKGQILGVRTPLWGEECAFARFSLLRKRTQLNPNPLGELCWSKLKTAKPLGLEFVPNTREDLESILRAECQESKQHCKTNLGQLLEQHHASRPPSPKN